MKKLFYSVFGLCMAVSVQAADVVTFENVLTLDGTNAVLNADNFQRNFYDEDAASGCFTSENGDFVFDNYCMEDWDFYCGFSISARTQTNFVKLVPDQFNSCVGHGVNGSARYAVFYDAGSMMPAQKISVGTEEPQTISGFFVTNTAWVVQSILNGDGTNDAFSTGDYLKLIITGKNKKGDSKSVEVFLADYTSEDATQHYYLNDWKWVDLSSLGAVSELSFKVDGTKKNTYGLTTPTYFCMDNFNGVDPATMAIADFENLEIGEDGHMSVSTGEDDQRTSFTSGNFEFATGCMHDYSYWYWFGYSNRTDTKYEELDDQWNNIVGGGHDGSKNFGVSFAAAFNGPCYVTVLKDEPVEIPGFYITNSSYAYTSMTNGDGFAKKFEKGDWFLLTIKGYDADNKVTGTKEYYLADLRSEKASEHYIISDWRYVDLSVLGKVKKIGFELSSSDNGDYGMNTPAYFCFDDFGATGTETLPEGNITVGISAVEKTQPVSAAVYDANGRQLNSAKKGLNIVRMSDGSVRKVIVK